MTIKLPDLVPFNDPVAVCVWCRRACCVQNPQLRCARFRGEATTCLVPLQDLQACPSENQSYWKGDTKRDPDIPIDLFDLHELVRDQCKRAPADERGIVASYLLHELRIDPEQVAEAMAAEWPEAKPCEA